MFCLRWESLYPCRQPQPFCNLHFSRLFLSITDNVEKLLKSMGHGLSLKNPPECTVGESSETRVVKLPPDYCVRARFPGCLTVWQAAAIPWLRESLGCLSCIFTGLVLLFGWWLVFQITLKWSKQYLVTVCQHLREKYSRLTNSVYEFWSGRMHILTTGRERHKCFSVLPST